MLVKYKLKTDDLWDFEERRYELNKLSDWIYENTGFDHSVFEIHFRGHPDITIWFEHDEHAILFKLRWAQ